MEKQFTVITRGLLDNSLPLCRVLSLLHSAAFQLCHIALVEKQPQ